jgi:mono/diheme cytochrome c family protein
MNKTYHWIIVITGAFFIMVNSALADSKADKRLIERGRYIIKVSGCNDCHTPGYPTANGQVPVRQWLTGDNFGWSGPWGTTYGSNLRLFMKDMTEAQWIKTARALKRRPPMPWFNLNAMSEDDLRAIYHFTKSLGEPGKPAPAALAPGVQPNPPYALFPAPPPKLSKK